MTSSSQAFVTPSKRLGFFTRLLDDVTPAERYQLALAQIVHAEAQGFDSAWVAQHHFHAHEGGLPSPFVFLAQVASKTQRIRFGPGVITLPMENAIRVAEDAAVLDLLSNGRLEVGVGVGGTVESFEAFGLTFEQRHAVLTQNLELLRKAWSGKPLAGGDVLYPSAAHLNDRVWQATFSDFGGRVAGQAGDGLMLSRTQPRKLETPNATLADIQNPIIDAYLAALPESAVPRIVASRTLFVADDRAQALHFADLGLRRFAARQAATGRFVVSPDAPLEVLLKTYDVHTGTPDDVIASLRTDTALARATDLVFQVHSIDPPHAHILRSIELIAKHVAPALGWSLSQATHETGTAKP